MSRNSGKWQVTSGKRDLFPQPITRNSQLLYWLPALLYMLLIFILSCFPAPEPFRKVPIIYDIKLVHIVEYGILSLLYAYALKNTTQLNKWQLFWTAVIFTIAYGITDELHQLFVPQRTCKVSDVLGNTIGALLFQLGYLKFNKKKLG